MLWKPSFNLQSRLPSWFLEVHWEVMVVWWRHSSKLRVCWSYLSLSGDWQRLTVDVQSCRIFKQKRHSTAPGRHSGQRIISCVVWRRSLYMGWHTTVGPCSVAWLTSRQEAVTCPTAMAFPPGHCGKDAVVRLNLRSHRIYRTMTRRYLSDSDPSCCCLKGDGMFVGTALSKFLSHPADNAVIVLPHRKPQNKTSISSK